MSKKKKKKKKTVSPSNGEKPEEEKENRATGQSTSDHSFRRYHHVLPERQGMPLCQQAPRRIDRGT